MDLNNNWYQFYFAQADQVNFSDHMNLHFMTSYITGLMPTPFYAHGPQMFEVISQELLETLWNEDQGPDLDTPQCFDEILQKMTEAYQEVFLKNPADQMGRDMRLSSLPQIFLQLDAVLQESSDKRRQIWSAADIIL